MGLFVQLHHLTDPMYSTLAILDATDQVRAVYYSSYGVPTATRPGDVDGDGDLDTTDSGYFIASDIADVGTNTNYTVELDMDRSGTLSPADFRIATLDGSPSRQSTLGPGVLSDGVCRRQPHGVTTGIVGNPRRSFGM